MKKNLRSLKTAATIIKFIACITTAIFCIFSTTIFAATTTNTASSTDDLSAHTNINGGNTTVTKPLELNDADLNTAIDAKELQRLTTVIAEIKKYYVKPVANHELYNNAISGMLYGLDPHSEYLNKEDLESLSTLTAGKFGGIGIELVPSENLLKVITPLDGTPAAKAGIKPGDVVAEVDGKLVQNMSIDQAIKLMRGPENSKVTLTIIRKNRAKPLVIAMKRKIISVQSVKSEMLEPGYYYARIAFFQTSTAKDLAAAINKMKQSSGGKVRGLVLDLRNNPGGLLDASVAVSDEFLDASKLGNNKIIVYTKGSNKNKDAGARIVANATNGELLPNVPLIVLINEGSASAAEIAAGALQDHKRAVIIGERSFGKGSVQTLLPVDEDSAIKLTTALYYTPLGRSIQAKGIEPDITVTEMKLSKKNSDSANESFLDEASFSDHLKNGNDADDANANAKKVLNKDANSTPPVSSTQPSSTDTHNTSTPNNTSPSDTNNDAAEQSDQATDLKSANNSSLKLANKDYQLYEALQILKGLAAQQKAN